MILQIGDTAFTEFNEFELNLAYDAVASTFGFKVLYNPENSAHREAFKALQYKECTIEHKGKLILTGTIVNHSFTNSAQKHLVTITGYSKPGVLEDCQIPTSLYPLQTEGLSLKEITQRLIKPFGLKLQVIDGVRRRGNKPYYKPVTEKADKKIETSTAYETQSIKEYLTEIASHLDITITHNNKGELVFTEPDTDQEPVIIINDRGGPATEITLEANGQDMHSQITVQRQASIKGGNAGEHTVANPYCTAYRPKVISQTTGDDTTTEQAARAALGAELTAIRARIQLKNWTFEDHLITPNSIITIEKRELQITKPARLFVNAATYTYNEKGESAALECVLPEVYTQDTPTNIFK